MIDDLISAYVSYFATAVAGCLSLIAGWAAFRRLIKW